MYNQKDIQFIGKHDYDKSKSEIYAKYGTTFSVNIFQWVLKKDGKSMKPSKCVVRVHGNKNIHDTVFTTCENIVRDLDENMWDGRKNVFLK